MDGMYSPEIEVKFDDCYEELLKILTKLDIDTTKKPYDLVLPSLTYQHLRSVVGEVLNGMEDEREKELIIEAEREYYDAVQK